MSELGQNRIVGFRGTAIITGENDQGIFCYSICFKRMQDLSHGMIHLKHKIPIWIGFAFSQELICWKDRCMRGRKGEVQEKGFVWLAGQVFVHEGQGFLSENLQDILMHKVIPGKPASPPAIFRLVLCVFHRDHCTPVIFNIDIWRDIQRGRNAKEIIKTKFNGTACYCFGKGHTITYIILILPSQSQVPFSYAGSCITMFLQQLAHCGFLRLDQGLIPTPQNTLFQSGSPGVTTSQYPVTGRGADC